MTPHQVSPRRASSNTCYVNTRHPEERTRIARAIFFRVRQSPLDRTDIGRTRVPTSPPPPQNLQNAWQLRNKLARHATSTSARAATEPAVFLFHRSRFIESERTAGRPAGSPISWWMAPAYIYGRPEIVRESVCVHVYEASTLSILYIYISVAPLEGQSMYTRALLPAAPHLFSSSIGISRNNNRGQGRTVHARERAHYACAAWSNRACSAQHAFTGIC